LRDDSSDRKEEAMTETGRAIPTEPQTISGRAWLSGMRLHHRRAATPLILSIEREAAKPALDALRATDAVLAELVTIDPVAVKPEVMRELLERARAAHAAALRVLAE
jgi:hypothetical protein